MICHFKNKEGKEAWNISWKALALNGYNTEILDHFCNAIVQMIRESLREDVTAEKVGAVVGDVVKSVFEKMQKADGEEEEETAEPEREEAAEEETK